jgi:hypothetical protein
MSLPTKAIDRLFERLGATYGAAWRRMWDGVPLADVKTAWAHELGGFGPHLHMLAWALENLPEIPPNVIQFRNLAKRAPAPEQPRLPEPKANPERLKAELAKLEPILADAKAQATDQKEWARRILRSHKAGQQIGFYALRCAKEALKGEDI